jgi:hypothetical protein
MSGIIQLMWSSTSLTKANVFATFLQNQNPGPVVVDPGTGKCYIISNYNNATYIAFTELNQDGSYSFTKTNQYYSSGWSACSNARFYSNSAILAAFTGQAGYGGFVKFNTSGVVGLSKYETNSRDFNYSFNIKNCAMNPGMTNIAICMGTSYYEVANTGYAKFDQNGIFQASCLQDANFNIAYNINNDGGIAIDDSGNSYLGGSRNITYYAGTPNYNYSYTNGTSAASNSCILQSYSGSSLLSTYYYGSQTTGYSYFEGVNDLVLHTDGFIYIAAVCWVASTSAFQIAIAKFNTSWALQWQRRIGQPGSGADLRYPKLKLVGSNLYVAWYRDYRTSGVAKYSGIGNANPTLEWKRDIISGNPSGSGNSSYFTGIDVYDRFFYTSTPSANNSIIGSIVTKLPIDGSLTGTYTFPNGLSFTYQDSTCVEIQASFASGSITSPGVKTNIVQNNDLNLTSGAVSLTNSIKILQ